MENTNDTSPPANKALSNFKALQEREHYIQAEDTNDRVHRTLTYRQFAGVSIAMFIALVLLLSGAGKVVRGSYWFEVSNEEWWLSSHFISCAILEDDPKFLTLNDGAPWEEFKKRASTIRMNGFILVVHDGEHPNLQRWYMQDQLVKSEPDSEDSVAGN